jgi:aldehyde dehydrogenase (NAD+)
MSSHDPLEKRVTAVSSFDPAALRPRGGHYIGGTWHSGRGAITVRRPSDNQAYGEIPDAGAEGVDQAVRSAQTALHTTDWSRRAPRERGRAMRRWAELVETDAPTLGQLEAVGSTRPVADAVNWDVPFTAEGIRFFSEFADKYGGDIAATQSDHFGMVIAEPIGVIGAIAPWNFPLVMASWKCAPALAAGNAVVLKPSEMTPFSALRLAELAVEAGIPAGIFNVVNGLGHTTGAAIARHPGIGKVTFTGSTRTGAAIMADCALSGPKPVTLELGGKNPQLVFDDATDLDSVADSVARAILTNAGQVCVAGSRLIVQRRVAEALLDRIVARARRIKAGPTWHADTTFPPIVSETQAARIADIVTRTVAAGATAMIGGHRSGNPQNGAFYEPTVLIDVDPTMEAVREEIFGPVLTVQRFDEDDEAFALANDSRYGLAAGVYTSDLNRALRALRALQVGTVWINRYGRTSDFVIPTGGYKQSGIGKDLGRQAYESSLRFKSALIAFDQT